MNRLVLATSNAGKLAELKPLLAEFDYALVTQGELGVADAVEDGRSFIENAIIKARHASAACRHPLGRLCTPGGRVHVGQDGCQENGVKVALPLKEFELLELLLENVNRVLTRGQIIDSVWGHDYYGDTKTLDVHVKRLRSKIEADPARPQHLITVRGLGYKFEA